MCRTFSILVACVASAAAQDATFRATPDRLVWSSPVLELRVDLATGQSAELIHRPSAAKLLGAPHVSPPDIHVGNGKPTVRGTIDSGFADVGHIRRLQECLARPEQLGVNVVWLPPFYEGFVYAPLHYDRFDTRWADKESLRRFTDIRSASGLTNVFMHETGAKSLGVHSCVARRDDAREHRQEPSA